MRLAVERLHTDKNEDLAFDKDRWGVTESDLVTVEKQIRTLRKTEGRLFVDL